MSPRAACRLEALGFEKVSDYTAGIAEWKAAGMPVEGSEDSGLSVADATRPDVATVRPQETLVDAQARMNEASWDDVLVVDCDGVVVGRLRGEAWNSDPSSPVEQVMELGPTTVRPDGSLHSLLGRMEKRGTRMVVVSDPQGRLIGVVLADDARRLVSGERPQRVWKDCEGCPGRWSIDSAGK